jgi:hypothetical protein
LLEPVETAFNPVALTVVFSVKRASSLLFVRAPWDSDTDAAALQRLAKFATAIALVSNNALRTTLGLSTAAPLDTTVIQ